MELSLYPTCPFEALQDNSEFPTLQDQCKWGAGQHLFPGSLNTNGEIPYLQIRQTDTLSVFHSLCFARLKAWEFRGTSLSEAHEYARSHVEWCPVQHGTSSWFWEEFRKHISETMGVDPVLRSYCIKWPLNIWQLTQMSEDLWGNLVSWTWGLILMFILKMTCSCPLETWRFKHRLWAGIINNDKQSYQTYAMEDFKHSLLSLWGRYPW